MNWSREFSSPGECVPESPPLYPVGTLVVSRETYGQPKEVMRVIGNVPGSMYHGGWCCFLRRQDGSLTTSWEGYVEAAPVQRIGTLD